MAGQKIGTFARNAAVRIPSRPVSFARVASQPIQELARRVASGFETEREVSHPVVVVDELFLARIRIVDTVDAIRLKLGVVGEGRADVVMAAAALVQVVIEVGAGGDDTIDVAGSDELGDHHSQAAGAQRSCHPQKDGHVVVQHLSPDAVRGGQCAPLERDAFHARQQLVGRESGFGKKRLDGGLKESRFLRHAGQFYCSTPAQAEQGPLVVADQRAVRSSWRLTLRRKEKSAEGSSFTPDKAACLTATFVLYQRLMYGASSATIPCTRE